ncbi:MAG: Ig-like domain-containing protein, partial [Bacteroidales bacterium]|nr:Ig-like domain-containing protein [Candidatus Sodaliphilus aphodohippi]
DVEAGRISTQVKEDIQMSMEHLGSAIFNGRGWMAGVDGKKRICDLAIPGTHDSGTSGVSLFTAFAAQTQVLSVSEQWDYGIRAFDLRVRDYKDGIEICHGNIPCEISFEDAFRAIVNKVRGTKEFALVKINSEGNPAAIDSPFWSDVVALLSQLATYGLVDVRFNNKDELVTRQRIANAINEILPPEMLCYYRPDLTLEEARGKVIIFNKMSAGFKNQNLPFVGQVIENNNPVLISDDPSKCPNILNAIKENDLYFAFDSDFKDSTSYNAAKIKEYMQFASDGYKQRITGQTETLFFNGLNTSYPDSIFGNYTPLCDYATAARDVYPLFTNKNKTLRSCGFLYQDYAGVRDYKRCGLQATAIAAATGLAAAISTGVGIALYPGFIEVALLAAIKLMPSMNVYADETVQSAIQMNYVQVPVKSAGFYNSLIYSNVGHKERLSLMLEPFDATEGTKVVSWKSTDPSVATVDNNGNVEIKSIGEAVITATLECGLTARAHVCSSTILPRDLGLSVMWGDRNFMAGSPLTEGALLQWGGNSVPQSYDEGHYRWINDENGNIIKYNKADGKRQLDLTDDVMLEAMPGTGWRTPTIEEVNELLEKCKITPTQVNGVNVLKVERNGNTIYFSETHLATPNGIAGTTPPGGYFWTKSIFTDPTTHAAQWEQGYCMRIQIGSNHFAVPMNFKRWYGMPIRPVKDYPRNGYKKH